MSLEKLRPYIDNIMYTTGAHTKRIVNHIISAHETDTQWLIVIDATSIPHEQHASITLHIQQALSSVKMPVYVSFSAHKSMPTNSQQRTGAASPPKTLSKKRIPHVQSVVLVASGKGGVGKSTTALNLAIALRDLGLRVGLLDADIYGPSLPLMVNTYTRPDVTQDKKLIPIQHHGIAMMSMGFLINQDQPIIWRGPMVQGALQQLLFDVSWNHHHISHDLDVLIIDTPPGTGDVHLTLAQNVYLDGAIIVSTPQDMALIDARKAIQMFYKISVPILGVIENMSYFICPHCGEHADIFHQHGAEKTAIQENLPFLGAISLSMNIRQACDQGIPLTQYAPHTCDIKTYHAIAETLKKALRDINQNPCYKSNT